jgi:endoglucanase Acf2
MFIIHQEPQPGKKQVTDNRGGFGTVARRAKAQTIRKYMSFLYKNQNWMIATTSSSKKNRDYHIITAGEFDNTITNEKKGETIILCCSTINSNR